jgi:two-component system chemotaxis response regulator CheB
MAIKLLIMEAAAPTQAMLTAIVNQNPDFTVVSGPPDVAPSHDTVLQLRPDVLLLSAELPRMDVLQFLRKLMRLAPIPVLVSSTLSPRGADITLSALELGAVDFVAKPRSESARAFEEYADAVMRTARIAQRARTRPMGAALTNRERTPAPIVPGDDTALLLYRATDQIVAVGAATGGVGAIREILCRLPAEAPAMLIAQPMPKALSAAFAQRMNSCSLMTVHEAMDGQSIQMGHVYLAPGGQHLLVERGAATVAQDERSSVVWGMAGSAVNAGAAGQILPLEQIAGALLTLAAHGREGRAARA